MALCPISSLQFVGADGGVCEQPEEWAPGLIAVDCQPERWEQVRVTRNGVPLSIVVRALGGQACVLAEWPRSGAGSFELILELADDGTRERHTFEVTPRKLTAGAVSAMLQLLQDRLPASIAFALQSGGALAGLNLVPPGETTLAEELSRLRRAIEGTSTRPGLAVLLPWIAERPFEVLRARETWSERERARRIDTSRLVQAFTRPGNLAADHLPLLVPERPVEPSADNYENRVLRAFYNQVHSRARHLIGAARREGLQSLLDAAAGLLVGLERARQAAPFLDEVGELVEAPSRVTMVLARRAEYRAALEGFLEFRKSGRIELRERGLDAPVENLPYLYECWGTLEVLTLVLETANELGYLVRREALSRRRPGELWITLLRGHGPAVVLTHPDNGITATVTPQRRYQRTHGEPHSVSFDQIPDVALEVTSPDGPTRVYLFDPKYKLDSEETDLLNHDGRPKKADIDRMHAYRDAIRDETGRDVVEYAATLYPGQTISYTAGLAALRAHPSEPASLRAAVRAVVRAALTGTALRAEITPATSVPQPLDS